MISVLLLYSNCFIAIVVLMNYTTTTKLARNGKKEFDQGIKVVLYNNEDIGLIMGKDFYDAIKDSGLIEQLREEMWEAKDKTTQMVLEKDAKGDYSDAIDFDDFRKKYKV